MKRRKRTPIKIKPNDLRYRMSKWCKLHYKDGTLFDIPLLCKELKLNPDSRNDYNKVYSNILSWRNGFIEKYKEYKTAGQLIGLNKYEAWDTMLDNYNKNDAYIFLSKYDPDAKVHCFIQPSFHEIERMDMNRLEKQWRGIKTVVEEMHVYDAQLVLSDGKRKPVDTLLKAGKKVDGLLGEKDAN